MLSAPRMKLTGPLACPPAESCSCARADRREVDAGAGAALEDHALGLAPVEDRLHRVLDGEDEAGRALRLLLDADVEPDRAVERHLLVDEQVRQLVVERLRFLVASRSSRPSTPQPVIVLATRPIICRTLRSRAVAAQRAAEVLRDDDVGRRLRPRRRDLDVLLLEERLAALVRDGGRAQLPLEVVVRIITGAREEALDGEGSARERLRRTSGSAWRTMIGGIPFRC